MRIFASIAVAFLFKAREKHVVSESLVEKSSRRDADSLKIVLEEQIKICRLSGIEIGIASFNLAVFFED